MSKESQANNTRISLKEKLKKDLPILMLLCFSVGWVLFHWDIYLDPERILPRDNVKHHLPMFQYVVRHLQLLKTFPNWLYSHEGGMWLNVLANNFLVLMPTHLIGYFIAAFTQLPINFVYKASVFLGQGVFCLGIFLVSRHLFSNLWTRVGVVVLSLLTSVTLTFQYQEHALGTFFYIPYLWLLFFEVRKRPWAFFYFCTLLGLSLNNHYPQLIIVYVLVLGLGALADLRSCQDFLKETLISVYNGGLKLWLFSGLALFISASPMLYSYAKYSSKLQSPFRLQEGGIETQQFDQYMNINSGYTKLFPENLQLYFRFEDGPRKKVSNLDDCILYMSPVLGFILFLLVLLPIPKKIFHIFVLTSLWLLSTGTHTFLPKILWYTVPGINLFRQWLFFAGFANLHILYLIFFVGLAFLRWTPAGKRDVFGAALGILLFLSLTLLGVLPAQYGVPGVFLLASKLYPILPHSSRVVGAVFWSWTFLGAFFGASFIQNDIRKYLGFVDSTHLFTLEQGLKASPLGELKSTYREFVALPNEPRLGELRGLSSRSDFYSVSDKGEVTPIRATETPLQGGFSIPVPRGARHLFLSQLNDNQWHAESDGVIPLVIEEKQSVGVWVKVPSGAKRIDFYRQVTPWNYLIFLMWLPLLSGTILRLWHSLLLKPFRISRYEECTGS